MLFLTIILKIRDIFISKIKKYNTINTKFEKYLSNFLNFIDTSQICFT